MQTIGVTPAWHQATSKIIHNNDLAVLYDVLHVVFEQVLSPESIVQIIGQVIKAWIVKTVPCLLIDLLNPLLNFGYTRIG